MGAEEPGLKDSLLPYETWIQDGLRHVMRAALASVARAGLPGDHHFYLTFRTDHPEVNLPARLKAQYPHDMTIVLQHQFEDLETDPAGFSVTLYFGGVPARLRIPWTAVTQFHDPSVRFGLRFESRVADADSPADANTGEGGSDAAATPPGGPGEVEQQSRVVSLDAFRKRPPKS